MSESVSSILFAFLLLVNSGLAHKIPSVFVFGDSIFDAGNNHYSKNCTAQADFPPYGSAFFHHPTGRFTNGRTVADFITQFLGIGLQKPFLEVQHEVATGTRSDYPANGMNFASAGSGVLRPTNQYYKCAGDYNLGHVMTGVTPIQDQLQQFKSLIDQNLIDKKQVQRSLFFLESGSNDVYDYFLVSPNRTEDAYIQDMLTEVYLFVDEIYKLGARRIAIFSLGPVGCVPARSLLPNTPINSRCFGRLNKMVKNYNVGLENLVRAMPVKYHGAFGVYGSVYNTVQQFRAMPKRYGFVDVTTACCGDGTLNGMVQCGKEGYKICSNPNEYLFWDYFHPLEHTYKLISKALWAGGQKRIQPMNLKAFANINITTRIF